ncbi:hypothetical protein A2966_04310 [Candidatus Roizmanbacteria bacterium RIFCSPLOWO2_01_FULL_41_22]|uniref:DUF4367 domain-containing protein n=1 Tax=Candidatus Roizmanbacteria bacterium RIFCSPLOWO2_01_FULL_41_22 TaxID=1802067 RepID=A0A1F7J8P9_9BACT|nr:MAG: hypothetical protein A2966_04310 [Candidatus Roizmanbacteria bacterium RIFCSPLOWO2_01_FULL_41_22]
MKKATNQKTKTKTVVIVSFFLLFLVLLLRLIFPKHTGDSSVKVYPIGQEANAVTEEPGERQFNSRFLKLAFKIPQGYTVKTDDMSYVDLHKLDNQISVSRIATNFPSIDDHINDLSEKNHFTFMNKKNMFIGNLPTRQGFIGEDKTYFILANYWVYSFSTSSPELYGDLDQIARSFRYLP